jgi:biopolymer transport protein ExbD
MAMGSFDSRRHAAPMAEMNVVPLVDVMLVLLVIFIVTAPLLTHAVKIDLPKASSSANITKPEHIEFAIRASPPRQCGNRSRNCTCGRTATRATTTWRKS